MRRYIIIPALFCLGVAGYLYMKFKAARIERVKE